MAVWTGGEERVITATGVIGENHSASDTVTGYAGCQVVGAMTGTILCEASFDAGTTWIALALVNMNSGAAITGSTGITAAGIYRADVGAMPRYRWRCSALSSGTPSFYPSAREG